jgi:hypothetical protein
VVAVVALTALVLVVFEFGFFIVSLLNATWADLSYC